MVGRTCRSSYVFGVVRTVCAAGGPASATDRGSNVEICHHPDVGRRRHGLRDTGRRGLCLVSLSGISYAGRVEEAAGACQPPSTTSKLRRAAEALRPAAGGDAMTRISRIRLVEILRGSDAAMALLKKSAG
jgi:hypothetical protein